MQGFIVRIHISYPGSKGVKITIWSRHLIIGFETTFAHSFSTVHLYLVTLKILPAGSLLCANHLTAAYFHDCHVKC